MLGCQDCDELMPLLKTGDAKLINDKTKEINLDCRSQTLHGRDACWKN